MPTMPLSGLRISWLIVVRNVVLALLPASAASAARALRSLSHLSLRAGSRDVDELRDQQRDDDREREREDQHAERDLARGPLHRLAFGHADRVAGLDGREHEAVGRGAHANPLLAQRRQGGAQRALVVGQRVDRRRDVADRAGHDVSARLDVIRFVEACPFEEMLERRGAAVEHVVADADVRERGGGRRQLGLHDRLDEALRLAIGLERGDQRAVADAALVRALPVLEAAEHHGDRDEHDEARRGQDRDGQPDAVREELAAQDFRRAGHQYTSIRFTCQTDRPKWSSFSSSGKASNG